jgi:hypothetical protein
MSDVTFKQTHPAALGKRDITASKVKIVAVDARLVTQETNKEES